MVEYVLHKNIGGTKVPVTLNVSIDLGSDTMKVAYAFEYEGAVYYGKISKKGLPTEVAIPAVAYYDTQSKAWSYGYNISGRRPSILDCQTF